MDNPANVTRSPSIINDKAPKKILIIGEAGVGKSSLINVLIGRDEAAVSDSAVGCTFQFKTYEYCDTDSSQETWNFIDTVGLNETSHGTINAHTAAKLLINFIRHNRQGFHGVLIVMKKGRITESFEKNHVLFVRTMLNEQVPCVLVVSHCEEDEPMDNWKYEENNMKAVKDYCFMNIVCGTLKKGGRFEKDLIGLRSKTRRAVFESLVECIRPLPFQLAADLSFFKRVLNVLFDGLGIKRRYLSESYDKMLNYIKENWCLSEDDIHELKRGLP